ncbi:uncharacterized protein CELE_Y46H3D.1 [Caenorhabditis elegans]|uniref:Secreted protein n=1 Tax=Caenorhabditis elegans TaxID=6239 RepID=Q966B2_CAEEL|nr:Secreted protein [Caenorhabditis elegans]CCD69580.1 Secreted protein [Caenorhabditis elegans]|eukprot:NP_503466.1 Uncharacterized protein CELE_Y46H3D.1 [Caenorhabditis elegans]
MLQYFVLGYLVFEIIRLAQLPDVCAVKFTPPPAKQATPPAAVPAPEAPKSEVSTAKSG